MPSSPRDRPPYSPHDLISAKYSLREVLGEGGMAVVYRAIDTSCTRDVALKILRPTIARRRGLSDDHLRREAAVLVRLHQRTRNVVEVLTAGLTDDKHRLPYYVMERLRGRTLWLLMAERYVHRQPFEVIELTRTVTEVTTALACAHAMDVVHRDVKPQNVFLAEDYSGSQIAKLLDFGLSGRATASRDAGDAPAETGDLAFAGSRRYAAPEQLEGRAPTPATDVYAVGLLLHELLTFALPHGRDDRPTTLAQLAYNAAHANALRLSELRPDTPPALAALVAHCLSPDPAARPAAGDVANELRRIETLAERRLLGEGESKREPGYGGSAITDVDREPLAVAEEHGGGSTHVMDAPFPIAAEAADAPEPPAVSHGQLFFLVPAHPDDTAPLPVAGPSTAPQVEPNQTVPLAPAFDERTGKPRPR